MEEKQYLFLIGIVLTFHTLQIKRSYRPPWWLRPGAGARPAAPPLLIQNQRINNIAFVFLSLAVAPARHHPTSTIRPAPADKPPVVTASGLSGTVLKTGYGDYEYDVRVLFDNGEDAWVKRWLCSHIAPP